MVPLDAFLTEWRTSDAAENIISVRVNDILVYICHRTRWQSCLYTSCVFTKCMFRVYMPCSWKMERVMYLDTFSSTSFTFWVHLLPFTGPQWNEQVELFWVHNRECCCLSCHVPPRKHAADSFRQRCVSPAVPGIWAHNEKRCLCWHCTQRTRVLCVMMPWKNCSLTSTGWALEFINNDWHSVSLSQWY